MVEVLEGAKVLNAIYEFQKWFGGCKVLVNHKGVYLYGEIKERGLLQ